MEGIRYQLKSIRKDTFCLMTFLLPIAAAVLLRLLGSIDLTSLGGLRFGVLENDLSKQAVAWLDGYGTVTLYKTPEELNEAVCEPSTNIIGVKADGYGIRTLIAGDEGEWFRQTAVTLPALYEQRQQAAQTEIVTRERPAVLGGFEDILVPMLMIVAMFMGCTFNAVNMISEKEDGVALVNEILPMTSGRYLLQKVTIGFLCGCLSSAATAFICLRLSLQSAAMLLVLIVLSSFVAALTGLLIGTLSDGLMTGVVYIKLLLLLFMAVPAVCILTQVSGPLAALCNLVPSKPVFEGMMALAAGDPGAALKNAGILAVHCAVWFAFCIVRNKNVA